MNKITETAAPPWIARVEQFDITGVMMDVFVIVLAAFAALGFLDKAIGGRFGFDREIDSGLSTMGTMSVYIVGIYCVGTVLIEGNSETIGNATSFLPMDPSILSGGILAPDLGGQPIAMGLAEDRDMGFFSGLVIGGCLGQFVSFQLPVIFAVLDMETKQKMVRGFIYGIIAIPAGLVVGGLVMGIPPGKLFLNISIITLICLVLLMGFLKAPKQTEKIILTFSNIIKFICQILFVIVIAGLFIPKLSFVPGDLVLNALLIVFRMSIIVCGGLVLTRILTMYFGKAFDYLGEKMGTDKLGIIGLMLNMINSITAITLFSKMDDRGKIINGAICVSGAYILGGQLAFVISVAPAYVFYGYIASKITAGGLALAIALLGERKRNLNQSPLV